MGKIETHKEIVKEVLHSFTKRSYGGVQLANVTESNDSKNIYTVYTKDISIGKEINDIYYQL
jgi:hypothetical protein